MNESIDWERLCSSRDLAARRMRAVRLGDLPVVVFRDERGVARALLDRCPHRGVPLSMGTISKGQVTCCYHGWVFDGEGRCRHIPSNVEETCPKAMVATFETMEEGGYVWGRPTRRET